MSIDNYGGYFEVPHSNWTMARYDLARGFCGGMHENFMQKIFNNTRRLTNSATPPDSMTSQP